MYSRAREVSCDATTDENDVSRVPMVSSNRVFVYYVFTEILVQFFFGHVFFVVLCATFIINIHS